jgi:hypothetical protein
MAKTAPQRCLIFVYNADSSPFAQTLDFLHKAFSPDTYACNLCRVTYGTFGAKTEWKEFINNLPYRTVFYHRDEFQNRYPHLAETPLPAIFQERKDRTVELFAAAKELNELHSIEALERLISARLVR